MKCLLSSLFVLLAGVVFLRAQPDESEPKTAERAGDSDTGSLATEASGAAPTLIYTIPVHGEIGRPTLYIVRTGVKDAIEAGADYVVLDMDTPGGALDVTLQIMQMLNERFKGRTATLVDTEAMSAGALISAATERIYFTPSGVIGAAAPVSASGEDIAATMRAKIQSYLLAKVRSLTADHPYRAEVVSAMVDVDYELKIGDEVLKEKGKLLSLTAQEAMKKYGDPPTALLGAGIVDNKEALYESLAGSRDYQVRQFEMTWSIKLAQWLTRLSPLFLSIGGLLLFIEFKTPGFGWAGISGIILLLLVFFGHNVAGLSGSEPALFFLLGVVLVLTEVLFFPGTFVPGVVGIFLIVGSLIWGMTDVWPGEAFELRPDMFVRPIANLLLGGALSVVLILLMARFLPRGWIWDRMVLRGTVYGVSGRDRAPVAPGPVATAPAPAADALIGQIGVAVTGLFPSGEIEIAGRRVQARLDVDSAPAGTRVRVLRRSDFVYLVAIER